MQTKAAQTTPEIFRLSTLLPPHTVNAPQPIIAGTKSGQITAKKNDGWLQPENVLQGANL